MRQLRSPEEKLRQERKDIEAKGLATNRERLLATVDGRAGRLFASQLAGLGKVSASRRRERAEGRHPLAD